LSGFDKKIRKIVIGNGVGGLKLSHYAVKMLAEKLKSNYYYPHPDTKPLPLGGG
jgi:hypothetical protein